MLEQNIVKYQDLMLLYYTEVNKNALNSLEGEIKKAFSAGFEEIKKVPEIFLFRWTVKLVCGIL